MFYNKVIRYCEENNMSVMAFEQKCGLKNGTVGKWKDGKYAPRFSSLEKIAKATNIPISQWVEG